MLNYLLVAAVYERILSSEEEIESHLNGKTLLIYLSMLRSQGSPVGVREVQGLWVSQALVLPRII